MDTCGHCGAPTEMRVGPTLSHWTVVWAERLVHIGGAPDCATGLS